MKKSQAMIVAVVASLFLFAGSPMPSQGPGTTMSEATRVIMETAAALDYFINETAFFI